MGLNINQNGNHVGRKKRFVPSRLNSVFYWTGQYDGTSLVNEVGTNVPWVSGTGLDAIYNFSVLNDDRFDKSNITYWGTTLADYFYYDSENPCYSKLQDFHYYYTEVQFTGLDSYNTMFLKAKATTNTSNEIESVSGLVVYSTSLVDSKLTKTKNWIGIQTKLYGDNIIPEASSTFETDGTSYYSGIRGTITYDSVNECMSFEITTASPDPLVYKSLLTIGSKYYLEYKARSDSFNGAVYGFTTSTLMDGDVMTSVYQVYTTEKVADQAIIGFIYLKDGIIGDEICMDDIILKQVYENYYKQ